MIRLHLLRPALMCTLAIILVPAVVHAEALDDVARLQNFTSQRASSSNPDLNKNGDSRSIATGETLALADLQGPGIITHIWCTVGSDDPFYGRALILRMYWDGADKPSVQAPLGDFFGVGHGALVSYTSQPVAVTSYGRARTCFWRMPFRKAARITVTNESDKYRCDSFYYYVDWQKHETLPDDVAYFHAQYRQACPAQPGDYTLLETTGRGHYVGTVYSVHQVENGWFGEGDDRFYIDGEPTPSLRGTGTEDYFCDAWGFRPFATPYYGVPLFEGYFAGDRVTAYRWHIPDPIAFAKSLKVTIEHRGSIFTDQINQLESFAERPDWISSVAFWYQSPPAPFDLPLPPLAERLPPYQIIPAVTLETRANPPLLLIKQKDGVMYMPSKPDASLELDFDVPAKGRYLIQALMPHAILGSLYQPLLDGKPFGGPIDLCVEGMEHLCVRLDQHDLTEGKHTLRFDGRGPSPHTRALAKPAFAIGIESLILLRLEDMKGYQETSKRLLEERKPKQP